MSADSFDEIIELREQVRVPAADEMRRHTKLGLVAAKRMVDALQR